MSDVAPHTELRCIHLCSGYGGFELGFKLAGINARTVAHVERDTYAAATLVARMGEKALDQAPIWDDLTTFDGAAWRGKVDCITAGFPCQPFSAAGSQKGIDDDRWLWPAIAGILRNVGPRYVFLENVPGLVRAGLPFVLGDLADLGYDAEWGLFSAAEVGAPHKRERFWLLGYASGGEPAEVFSAGDSGPDVERAGGREGIGPAMADPDSARPERPSGLAISDKQELADAASCRSHAWPPTRDGNWDQYISQGGPQPSIRRGSDGPPAGLADSLHLGGNGLVPAVAAAAFIELLNRYQH